MFKWKLLSLDIQGTTLVSAEYQVTIDDGEHQVSTQGHWTFKNQPDCPYDQITEGVVEKLLEFEATQDETNSIKSNLEKQLAVLKQEKPKMPWEQKVFKPNL